MSSQGHCQGYHDRGKKADEEFEIATGELQKQKRVQKCTLNLGGGSSSTRRDRLLVQAVAANLKQQSEDDGYR